MKNNFMVTSNIFFTLPIVGSIIAQEWSYLFFSIGILIFSLLYHYSSEYGITNKVYKVLDWLFAVASHFYMYYFIFLKTQESIKVFLLILLSSSIAYFFYGYKFSDYRKFHPSFHVISAIIATVIVLSK